MKKRFRLPSPAIVIAIVALLVGLGGGAYAAKKIKLGKGTVKTKNIKDGAVTEQKIATPARGQSVAWAEVAANGSITASRGITAANLVSSGGGFYCFNNLPAHGTESVTPAWTGDEFGSFAIATISKPSSADISPACAVTQLAVVTQFFNIGRTRRPIRRAVSRLS